MRREIQQVHRAVPASDGAGVRLKRALGHQGIDMLDPFLMLDEFRSDQPGDYLAGFPDHPHRGFETVTYMLAGRMEHKDSAGNQGTLTAGSVQWMTAGSGIIHSEMPKQESGLMAGFQLWVNLPRAEKMRSPRYQEFTPEEIPWEAVEGGRVKLVAGMIGDHQGPVQGISVDPLMADLDVQSAITVPIRRGHNAFGYVFEGEVMGVGPGHLMVLGDGDHVEIRGEGRLLLVAGKPLREPVARHGPFVMSTREELVQAFEDYRRGTFIRR